ncbi:unnamed protein product [Angiostrongylus costaricensis]|uniref:TIMELESS_C domain-containing protein n=1 Tax=Angiostrongylus costaricensis TaxID=334426 RepID=A0A0R3PY62_ANGCS|nr:unnamed protein product [Angiostrongylus costaricensis]
MYIYIYMFLWEDRLEEDRLVMERIIRVHRFSTFLNFWFFIMDGNKSVFGLRYTKASQAKERDFHLSILSIFALILAEHVAGRQRTTTEKEKAEEELRQVVATEKTICWSPGRSIMLIPFFVLISANICRSVFGSIGFRPIKSLGEVTFLDERKNKKVTAKNRRPFEGKLKTHTSSMDLRIKLKLLVEEILSSCFNRLMKSTKELVYSDLHFFLLMRFLLEYNRLSGRASSEVSACLSIEAFHHVQVQISNYLESAVTMKKEAKQFGLRTQYSLSVYKELILFLQHLIENGSLDEKDLAHRTSYHILIVEEYREMGLAMIRKFSVTFLSKTYLSELILSTHHYLQLLQNAVKLGQLNTVKKRSKIRRRIARGKKSPLPALVDNLSSEELSIKWSCITNELKDIILGNLECSPDQTPVNSLLDVREEQHQYVTCRRRNPPKRQLNREQRIITPRVCSAEIRRKKSVLIVICSLFRKFAMLKVQRALRESRTKDAMGLYRSSRELWPADGIFGDPDSSVEEQLDEIHPARGTNQPVVQRSPTLKKTSQPRRGGKPLGGGLIFITYYFRYVFLLNDFATNSVELNKALVKLLHRIAFNLDMPSRLFQLSLFRIFAQVRTYFKGIPKDDMRRNPLFELFNFGHHLLKKSVFFSCYGILEDKLAPEILFWKGPKECYEIQNGYGTYETGKRTTITPNLSRACTRKQIYKKLKEFALDPLGARANKDNEGEEFSRRRILKQINYQGIIYEKKKSVEKKPRRQVERELKAFGVTITPRSKSEPTKLVKHPHEYFLLNVNLCEYRHYQGILMTRRETGETKDLHGVVVSVLLPGKERYYPFRGVTRSAPHHAGPSFRLSLSGIDLRCPNRQRTQLS